MNRLLDALDLSDWEALEIDDPVEWVKALRRKDEVRLDPLDETLVIKPY